MADGYESGFTAKFKKMVCFCLPLTEQLVLKHAVTAVPSLLKVLALFANI